MLFYFATLFFWLFLEYFLLIKTMPVWNAVEYFQTSWQSWSVACGADRFDETAAKLSRLEKCYRNAVSRACSIYIPNSKAME